MKNNIEFIRKAGGCIVSNNIMSGKGKLMWCLREESMDGSDNGWRFFSDIDTEDYLSDSSNLSVCDFNTVAQIEPAIIAIYLMKVGTDLRLVNSNGKKKFIDNETGEEVYPQ